MIDNQDQSPEERSELVVYILSLIDSNRAMEQRTVILFFGRVPPGA